MAMSWPDRLEWLEIAMALLRAQVRVRVVPFRRLASGFDSSDPGSVAPPMPSSAERERVSLRMRHRVARMAALLPVRVACLGQSLAAADLLRRRGCDVRMYLGTTVPTAGFAAHAWLCSEGVVVTGEREAAAFTAVASFFGRGRG